MLNGKHVLVMGVANKRSIAWAIAQALHQAGARLIFTYQGERYEQCVRDLISETMPDAVLLPCDVTKDAEIDAVFQDLEERVGVLHGVVHSLAFAKADDLAGRFLDVSRDGYLLAQNISSYSLLAVANRACRLMKDGGSILTMTYLGGERVVENYHVMGAAKAALEMTVRYLANDLGPDNIRVNGISAGPIRTLAAKGVRDFNKILQVMETRSPLRRAPIPEEVADTALFLMSHLSRGITGEIIHVDGGFHVLGL